MGKPELHRAHDSPRRGTLAGGAEHHGRLEIGPVSSRPSLAFVSVGDSRAKDQYRPCRVEGKRYLSKESQNAKARCPAHNVGGHVGVGHYRCERPSDDPRWSDDAAGAANPTATTGAPAAGRPDPAPQLR